MSIRVNLLSLLFLSITIANDKHPRLPVAGPVPPINIASMERNSNKEESQEPAIMPMTTSNLTKVQAAIMDLLDVKGVQPHEILVISDVDGTLTNHREPNPLHPTLNIKARTGAVELIDYISKKQVYLVIASAWDIFDHTLERLKAIGLGEILHISTPSHSSLKKEKVAGQEVEYYVMNNICSARLLSSSTQYFFNKALTPYLVYPLHIIEHIKYVFFIDDSSSNRKLFINEVKQFKLFNKAKQVKAILLTSDKH